MTKEEKKEYNKAYREKNIERIKEIDKAYYEKNRDKIAEKTKVYRKDNKERIKEYKKAYYENNKDKIAEKNKDYRKDNKERIAEWNKAWREKNKDILLERKRAYENERRKTDPLFKLKCNLRASSGKAFKGKSKPATTEKLLGCSYNDFKDYIESQFVGNMSWNNYGDAWHIDHIIPLAVIENVNQIELIESLCHFSNLQPLLTSDNISKHDRLDYEYPAIYKTNLLHNSNKKQL